jgi:hypothetical protein
VNSNSAGNASLKIQLPTISCMYGPIQGTILKRYHVCISIEVKYIDGHPFVPAGDAPQSAQDPLHAYADASEKL